MSQVETQVQEITKKEMAEITMNQAELRIIWDKTTGNLQVAPLNMKDTEVIPLLLNAAISLSNGVIEQAKKSGIQLATGPLPPMPGN